MRILTAVLLAFSIVTPALATDQNGKWLDEISKCWSMPSTANDVQPITMHVKIDQSGEVIGSPVSVYKDETGDTKSVAEALKRAILRCAPYRTHAGEYEFKIPQNTSTKASLASSSGHAVDVYTFDFAGVKLGMSYEEAISALARNFKVSERDIDDIKQSGADKNAGPDFAKKLSYSPPTEGILIHIAFNTRVPPDPLRILSVADINYKVSATETNRKLMEKALNEKYGRPTIFNVPGPMEWCKNPIEGPQNSCFKDAQLMYYNMELRLFDPSITDAAKKYNEEKNAVQPKF